MRCGMGMTMPESCFHCGNRVNPGSRYALLLDGSARAFCCGGCEAAAALIVAQGLQRFYQFRSATGPAPADAPRNWSTFDREAALRRYSHLRPDGEREMSLQIEGLHCAACAWLIENSLSRLAGLTDIHVNPNGARAELRFDPRRLSASRVLESIHALGYQPRPLSFTADDAGWTAERRVALKRLAVSGFGMMAVMTYAVSLYAGAMDGMDATLGQFLKLVSLVVATPVVLYAAQPFFIAAWRSVRSGTLGMDVPVALSIGAAYLWSVASTLCGYGAVYFDSAVMFTFFLLLGRYLEMSLRHRSGMHHDALASLLPDSALRVLGDKLERVTPDELNAGERVRVLPGERIAADGEILSGSTEVDESLVTGESAPRPRAAGDALIAGTLNLGGAIELRVTRVGQDSTLAAVSRLLERASASRPRVADVADRVAAWFVGGVLLLAALAGLYWLHADPSRAFPAVLAVLVVTCPCALSLATPAALAAGMTRLARAGLLVTRGQALERLAGVDRIVFDKTGTLTCGMPRIEDMQMLDAGAGRERCLAIAAALERHSEHPIARAFAQIEPAGQVTDVHTAPGSGLAGTVDGVRYRIGRIDYVRQGCPSAPQVALPPSDDACSSIVLGDRSGLLAAFLTADGLRADARDTFWRLLQLGVQPQIASGDRAAVVAAMARRLGGVPAGADMRADDKLALVHALQAQGHRVAMVGDGVNDAPVLAAADVSVAIGSGTDLAKLNADIVLLGDGLAPLVSGIESARRTRAVIRQNLAWAVIYNATAVPLAAGGWLEPWMAAIGMSASSLLVVLNATRLLTRDKARVAADSAPGDVPAAHA
jgi:P-type Cu2+ transporter